MKEPLLVFYWTTVGEALGDTLDDTSGDTFSSPTITLTAERVVINFLVRGCKKID